MATERISGSQFATRFSLRPKQLCWFLGSGASAAAGIPTGYAMIADFKKRLFCQLSRTKQQEVDINDKLWIERIDLFFQARALLPPLGDPTEYAKAFEAVYPTQELRRSYIEEAVKKGTPSFAHRVLASMLSTQRVPGIFTTNFDPLPENATTVTDQLLPAAERVHLTVAAIDNADRAALALTEFRPFLAKLHGDYQSLDLKNTSNELQAQDTKMREVLISACGRYGLVVIGYSGRDASIMQALTAACAQRNAFPGGIYWVTARPDSILPAVTAFLETATSAGISSALVESQTFDELASDIADRIELPQVLKEHIYHARPPQILTSVPIPTHEHRSFPILQCSAIPITSMPTVARRIAVSKASTTVHVRELLREANVWAIAASAGRDIAVFGPDEGVLGALAPLGPKLAGTIDLHPNRDSWALGLLYDALTRAVCGGRPLFARMRRAGHLVLVARGPADEAKDRAEARAAQLAPLREAYSSALYGSVPDHGLPFTEGVQFRIEYVADRWWCGFEPLTYVQLPRPEVAEDQADDAAQREFVRHRDPSIDWRRERWATRYNRVWARIIAAWATMLAGDGTVRAAGISEREGQDAVFQLSAVTAWSRPGNDHQYFNR